MSSGLFENEEAACGHAWSFCAKSVSCAVVGAKPLQVDHGQPSKEVTVAYAHFFLQAVFIEGGTSDISTSTTDQQAFIQHKSSRWSPVPSAFMSDF